MEMKFRDWLIAIVVCILFAAVAIGMGFRMAWLIAVCVGLLLIIISVLLVKTELQKPRRKLIAPITVLVIGVLVLLAGLIMMADATLLDRMLKANNNLLGRILCGLSGLMMFVLPLAGRLRKKHCCTEPVEAMCISQGLVRQGRSSYYCYTYEFQYEGKTETLEVHRIFSLSKMKVGREMTIWLDPVYRDEFYIPCSDDYSALVMAFGIILLLLSIFNQTNF